MNLVLLHAGDLIAADRAQLSGRRLAHLRDVLKAQPRDRFRVGLEGGMMGFGQLVTLSEQRAEMILDLSQTPPPSLPLTLIMALPRPKMLKRIFQTCATMGVKRLFLINAYRVEKSYWQSPWLRDEPIREQLILGLEQAMDTMLPAVTLRQRFKPFVEDELPAIAAASRKLVAHPGAGDSCPSQIREPVTLCIGPEGGFIPYEVEKLQEAGFTAVQLGPRILRVETAVPALIGRLFDPALPGALDPDPLNPGPSPGRQSGS